MTTLYCAVVFATNDTPLLAKVCTDNGEFELPLYVHNTKSNIYDIEQNIKRYRSIVEQSLIRGHQVVTSGFKQQLGCFKFQLPTETINVFDVPSPNTIDNVLETARLACDAIITKLRATKLLPWHKLFGNAAIAYEGLERRGACLGGIFVQPKWSQRTYSGRSKTTGVNIQGCSSTDELTSSDGSMVDTYVCLDWIAADIRAAALLSGDERLGAISLSSDPYTVLSDILNRFSKSSVKLTRDECKIGLLSAINAMRHNSEIISVFPKLKRWIKDSADRLAAGECTTSLLGREFRAGGKRTSLSAFNGSMQGTIAHAMHASLKSIWDESGSDILVEVHDGIIMTYTNDANLPERCDRLASIMAHPFRGILPDDPILPVKVSVGRGWKKWQEFKAYRI